MIYFSDFGTGGSGHRYWRVNSTANGGGTNTAILELEMYEAKFGQNKCTGGTASASSEVTAAFAFTADRAFDGSHDDGSGSNNTDLWAGNTSAEWLKYDFGAAKSIVALGMRGRNPTFANQMPTTFDVQWSDDNSAWTTAWSETGLSWSGYDFKRLVDPGYSPPSYSGSPHGSHSYWRIYINQTSVSATSVTELEFRATAGGADQANGGTASASSTFSGSFPASQAFDNNNSTIWHNGSSLNHAWLQYQFAAPVEVAQIMIRARNSGSPIGGPENIAVQYSDDGTLWTTAWVVLGETGWSLSEVRTYTDPNYV